VNAPIYKTTRPPAVERSASTDAADITPVISARKLKKIYPAGRTPEVLALEEVTFDIPQGEFVCLVGPSGCGKSTLLKMMAGLLPYSSGVLEMGGRVITEPGADVGFVFQSPVLLPWRTINENIMLPLEFRRLRPSDYSDRASALIKMVGLGGFEARYPHELSGGMQQRAAIARALLQDPRILLMDEPFGALDALTREQMNVEVLKIWTENPKTVVFVTHSIVESVFLADRVFVMTSRPGKIAEIVSIDLPRPRELAIINTEHFGHYVERIRNLLQAKSGIS
jgi:NitT/TauT family transport system ATP-binding protein